MEKAPEGEGELAMVGTTELGEAGFNESDAEFGQETADELEGPPRDRYIHYGILYYEECNDTDMDCSWFRARERYLLYLLCSCLSPKLTSLLQLNSVHK